MISWKFSRRHFLLMLPVFLLSIIFVIQNWREKQAERDIESIVRSSAPTFWRTKLPVSIKAFSTVVRFKDVILPGSLKSQTILLLPIEVYNNSSLTLTVTEKDLNGVQGGFYNDQQTSMLRSTFLCANLDGSDLSTQFKTHRITALDDNLNYFSDPQFIKPQQKVKFKVWLNYSYSGSNSVHPFITRSGIYTIRFAMPFKVRGEGEYMISEPIKF